MDLNIEFVFAASPLILGAPRSLRGVLVGDKMGMDSFLTDEEGFDLFIFLIFLEGKRKKEKKSLTSFICLCCSHLHGKVMGFDALAFPRGREILVEPQGLPLQSC